MQMALNSRVLLLIVVYTLVWNLACVRFSISTLEDIACLKAIKASVEDPLNRLTWNFDNLMEGFICKFYGIECWRDDENRVISILLNDMGLVGQFPRGIEDCRSLQELNLSGNNLYGQIPDNISHYLRYVVKLDLSNNRFSGEIPSNIANLTYLNTLMLDNNQLTGQIPSEIGSLRWIKTFSVSNNMLSGPVPTFGNFNVSPYMVANNSELCGYPLKPCGIQELTFRSGFVVGYVISAVSVLSVFISYFLPWVRVKKGKKITIIAMTKLMFKRKGADQLSQLPSAGKQNKIRQVDHLIKEISTLEKAITRRSLAYIINATDNFSQDNIIGMGQTGTMYRATLFTGQIFAVKRLHDSLYLEEQYMFELKTLARLKQQDTVVQLLGFCIESKEKLLAYEFLSNGNLYDWLHPAKAEPSHKMEWSLRVKIATGVARGLAWLHHNFGIVHLDISSKCILLDQNFKPKLSNFRQAMYLNPDDDFGTSRRSYDNRDFWQLDFIKEDVHSFGLLLLELITSKEPSKLEKYLQSFDGTLIEWITHLSGSSSIFSDGATSNSLIGQGFDGEISQFLDVAIQCVQPFPDQRPTMLEVYRALATIEERYGLDENSESMMLNEIPTTSTRNKCIAAEITEAN